MRFTWRRVTRRVVKSQGPERVAPEWWRLTEGERPRDYYVIEDEQGRLVVRTTTQVPFHSRRVVARVNELPPGRVRAA